MNFLNKTVTFAVFTVAGIFSFVSIAHASTCSQAYMSTVAVPSGYGAAYNVFSIAHELVVQVDCSTATAKVSVGSGAANQYIYKIGYAYKGGAWQQVALMGAGALISNNWYSANTYGLLPFTAADLANWSFVVAYICSWNGSAWQCGCSDTSCAAGSWQLQSIKVSSGNGSSNGTTAIPGNGALTDSQGSVWTITTSGTVQKDGINAGATAGVALIVIWNNSIYESTPFNGVAGWWQWTGSAWSQVAADPRTTIPAGGGGGSSNSGPVCGGLVNPPAVPPAQASAAGFNTLAYDDEFNTMSISADGSGSTFNWYAYGVRGANLAVGNYQVQNGCLTLIDDPLTGGGGGLTTVGSPNATSGIWQHAYFEARIQFDPSLANATNDWPSFWSWAIEQDQGANPSAELDFMEAFPTGSNPPTEIATTLHQWSGGSSIAQSPNNTPQLPAGFDYSAPHVYGTLWTTNSVTWYIDDQPVKTEATGPGTSFSAIEQEHMYIVLNTGLHWPMTVDYVHVWR